MYDITKTRMLLTTAVFAAVAALSASGANARIPADTSSASAVQESLRTGRYAAQPPSWRGKGGKGEETGDTLAAPPARRPPYSRPASLEAAQPPSRRGPARRRGRSRGVAAVSLSRSDRSTREPRRGDPEEPPRLAAPLNRRLERTGAGLP